MNLPASLNELYPVVCRWLERDLEGGTRRLTQAYADLMFAFVLAKAGDRNESDCLRRKAENSLDSADAIQNCLFHAFIFRIDRQREGLSDAGVLPLSVLSLASAGDWSDTMRRYAIDRMRHQSRILEPKYRVDAYLRFRREIAGFVKAWENSQDPSSLEEAIQSALISGGEKPHERLVAEAMRFAPLVGRDFSSHLLDRAIPRVERGDREGVYSLFMPSLTLAGELRDPQQIWPLVRVAVQWITAWNPSEKYRQRFTETVMACTQALAALGPSLESEECADQIYAAIWGKRAWRELSTVCLRHWAEAVNLLLQLSRLRRSQDLLEDLLEESRRVLFGSSEASTREVADLAHSYIDAVAGNSDARIVERMQELFESIRPMMDTLTTHRHFAAPHLDVLERALLAVLSSRTE